MNALAPASGLMHRGSFLGWWLRELSGLAKRSDGGRGTWNVLVQRTGDRLTLHQRQRNGIETSEIPATGASPGRKLTVPAQQVVLRLRPNEVVRRTLSLPRGERRDLEAIIRNQLEFLAPWPADKVLFDYELQPDVSPEQRLVPVVVTMTGRDIVEEAQRLLQGVGLRAGVVDSGEEIEPAATINLLRAAESREETPARGLRIGLTVLVAVALAVAALGGVRLFSDYRELQAIETSIKGVRVAADEALKLSASAAELRAKGERLAKRKQSDPPAILVIEVLSRALPGDTWLTNVEVRGRDVRIIGKSPNAASLIGILEGSKAFAKVRFAAPTTREAGQEIDTFSIVAEVAKVTELVQ